MKRLEAVATRKSVLQRTLEEVRPLHIPLTMCPLEGQPPREA